MAPSALRSSVRSSTSNGPPAVRARTARADVESNEISRSPRMRADTRNSPPVMSRKMAPWPLPAGSASLPFDATSSSLSIGPEESSESRKPPLPSAVSSVPTSLAGMPSMLPRSFVARPKNAVVLSPARVILPMPSPLPS
jgi:hypothetical protein